MIRLGIVDPDPVFRARVEEAARWAGDIDVVAAADLGDDGEKMIRESAPEVVLVDLSPPGMEGLALLRRLIALPPEPAPKVVVTAPVFAEDALAEAVALGADYAVLKPCHMETLLDRIRQHGLDRPVVDVEGERARWESVFEDVVRRLERIGVAPHFKGYRYLVDAIGFVAFDMSLLHSVTTELYPKIARRHGTTPQRVERAIRNAIEATLTRGNLDEIERLFGHVLDPAKGKISNSSFIAQLADRVRVYWRVG